MPISENFKALSEASPPPSWAEINKKIISEQPERNKNRLQKLETEKQFLEKTGKTNSPEYNSLVGDIEHQKRNIDTLKTPNYNGIHIDVNTAESMQLSPELKTFMQPQQKEEVRQRNPNAEDKIAGTINSVEDWISNQARQYDSLEKIYAKSYSFDRAALDKIKAAYQSGLDKIEEIHQKVIEGRKKYEEEQKQKK